MPGLALKGKSEVDIHTAVEQLTMGQQAAGCRL
jgi:hypothetical protein